MISPGVEQSRIGESSIVITVLVVESVLSLVGDADEVVDSLAVQEVLVKVVLEVLKDVHVGLDISVSPDARETERLVVELPGVDAHLRVETLSLELGIDEASMVVVGLVEVTREIVELLIQLGLGDIDSRFARLLEADGVDGADHSEDESHN